MHDVVPSPDLSFSSFDVRSSESPHGSAARSGRVAVAPRGFSELVAVARIDDGPRPGDPARFLDIPAHQDAIVVERPGTYEGVYEVRSRSGVLAIARAMSSTGSHVLARDEGYYAVGELAPWTDRDAAWSGGTLNQFGELLGSAVIAGAVRTLVASPDGQTPDHAVRPDYTRAEATPVGGAAAAHASSWDFKANEPGVGAIDASGRTLVALPSGRLLVLLPAGNGRGGAAAGVDATIDASATDLSIVPPFAMILYGGGDAGALAARRSDAFPASRLDARRPDGSLAWRAPATFLANQPPLDGAGRVYLVGAGIAAIDLEGRTLWSSPSSAPLRAQAFAEGTLAVVRENEVQIVGSDGTIRKSFKAEESLTSYPAIASDGTVWVASAKRLYVLR